MIRKIVIPQERTYVLELPEEFVGKEIEVLAFKVEENLPNAEKDLVSPPEEREERLREIENKFSKYLIDMSGYKFDRDEANDYE